MKKEKSIPKRSLESILNELTKYSNLNREDIPALLEHIKELQDKANKEASLEEVIQCLSIGHKAESGRYGDCGYITITLCYKDKVVSSTDISGYDLKSTLAD